jgi:hypothetical protein
MITLFNTNYSEFYELHEFLFSKIKIRVIRKIRHNSC